MKLNKSLGKFALICSLTSLSLVSCAVAQPDNTRANQRDRKSNELTADQQNFNQNDMRITQRIRQDIMRDKNMSTYGQNAKIITVNGKVTLKGPVRTAAEQQRILSYARNVAGESNVVNEMAIMPKKSN